MCYITDGAQDHLRHQDSLEPNFPENHICNACEQEFEPNKGFKIEDEKFCKDCVDSYKHFDFYRALNLSDSEIFETTEKIITI
jgi:hypothetical protein